MKFVIYYLRKKYKNIQIISGKITSNNVKEL